MTVTAPRTTTAMLPGTHLVVERTATPLRLLMCRPDHFEVTYAINPWMHPDRPVDTARAVRQWEVLKEAYLAHGHRVELVEGVRGLPDMVYAANAGLAFGDRALVAHFTHPERRPETAAFYEWFTEAGFGEVQVAAEFNEGEGDFLRAGHRLLAGTGFRTSVAAHREVAAHFGREVLTLELVDPRFYHLDTALAVLDDHNVAYHPQAFSPTSRAVLQREFPDAVLASEADALAFGLNAVSDGRHVFLSAEAPDLPRALAARGYEPVPIVLDELLKGGGSVKCCTLELHPAVDPVAADLSAILTNTHVLEEDR